MPYLIDYVLEAPDDDRDLGCPEGTIVKRNGSDDTAENVLAGDTVCVMPGFIPVVAQVGRTMVNPDGTRGARTVLSGGA